MKLLFTTLPSNDLGLLTRSLPIAKEMTEKEHYILFCSPAQAPSRLIADAGFKNLTPMHPIYDLMTIEDLSFQGLVRYVLSGNWRRKHGNFFQFMAQLIPSLPFKTTPKTSEVWDVGHAGAMMGMMDKGFVRASCDALLELIDLHSPDMMIIRV